jgi:integrase
VSISPNFLELRTGEVRRILLLRRWVNKGKKKRKGWEDGDPAPRERKPLTDLYDDQGLVFTTEAGPPINPSNLRQRSFAPLLKKAGLPHIRLHDLRHTCATLLLSKGVHPKFVQELLSHATIAITLDTYSHVIPGMGDQTATATEDALT